MPAQAAGRHMSTRTTMFYIREHAINQDALAAVSAVAQRSAEDSAALSAKADQPEVIDSPAALEPTTTASEPPKPPQATAKGATVIPWRPKRLKNERLERATRLELATLSLGS